MSPGETHKNYSVRLEYLLVAGVLFFYLPHLPRFFMGDDWLWLAQAERAMTDFSQLFSRSIYGYFRPFYLLYITLIYKLFGMHAFWFGLTGLLWHILNCHLLLKVLEKLRFPVTAAFIAALIFGFYYLEASTICWISAGSDIITLTLLLTLTRLLLAYFDEFTFTRLVLIVLVFLMALLVKELGFVGIALYFLLPFLYKKNPFRKRYLGGTVILLLLAAGYLMYYFTTRTVVDKVLITNLQDFFVNLWYFFIYLFLPLSKRMVTLFGSGHEEMLTVLRGVFVFALPLTWLLLIKRALAGERYFLLWPFILMAPVAVFDWSLGLFDLYPERTISRFMYAAVPGPAVVLGAIFTRLFDGVLRRWPARATVIIIFILFNFVVIHNVTGLYKTRQEVSHDIYRQLSEYRDTFASCESLHIYLSDTTDAPSELTNPLVMNAMGRVVFNREMTVRVFVVSDLLERLPEDYPGCTLKWLGPEGRLSPVWSQTPSRARTK
ncbi:MAG: hypothetical protein ACOYVF_13335 [Candidatus Zixiibacteriota bacterium]